MIQANELFIGMILHDKINNKAVKITIIDACQRIPRIGYQENEDTLYVHNVDMFSPIPLTSEILGKCGFTTTTENNDGSFNMWGKLIDASIDIEEGEVYKYRIYERIRTKNVKYLHQLQNLYFALTGKELEVAL